MDWVNSFLFVTAISYYMCIFLPKPVMRGESRIFERVDLFVSGSLLSVNIFLNFSWLWLIMSIIWTAFAGLSYLGYVKWNILWLKECNGEPVSEEAQIFMAAWNLTIAVCCMVKV